MRKSGQITVFLSLILLCVCSLLCGLIESARTAGTRFYLKLAADSALDSVFSEYHKEVWEKYRLFLLEFQKPEELSKAWEGYMKPYMEDSGWYSLKLEDEENTGVFKISDHEGMYLKQEILDYMRYGILDQIPDEDTAESIFKNLKEADAVKELSGAYGSHTREAVRLEQAIEDIGVCVDHQKGHLQAAYERADAFDGAGFRQELHSLEREMERIPSLIKTYQKRADDLKGNLEKTDALFETTSENLSEEVKRTVKEDTDCYKSYIEEEGERRREIESLPDKLKQQKPLLESAIERSYEVEDILDSWDGDEDEEGPDEEELWDSVTDELDRVSLPVLPYSNGVKDTEKERLLEQVEEFVSTGLLALVLPENSQVSQGVLNQEDFPSALYNGDMKAEAGLLDRLLVHEYEGKFLTSFTSAQDKEVKYEMEYLIGGKSTDEENLKQALSRLIMVREGMNLVHILSDGQKREEAKALAGVIAGTVGALPLTGVLAFFIMSIWALGEAICDVRLLLEGGKVAFVKTRENWKLSLEGLLALGQQGKCEKGNSSEGGLNYVSYLKLLLLTQNPVLEYYRLMDVIQMNIRRTQDSFRITNCIYQAGVRGRASSRRMFFGGRNPVFQIQVETEKAY